MTTNWDQPVLPPDKWAMVVDWMGSDLPEDYQSPKWAPTERDALIFYCYVKADADGLAAILGGVEAFHKEAARFTQWLLTEPLPERFTIYQGGREGHPSVSWTTDRKVAAVFAEYLGGLQDGAAEMRMTTIDREQVLIAYQGDIEREVIWRNAA